MLRSNFWISAKVKDGIICIKKENEFFICQYNYLYHVTTVLALTNLAWKPNDNEMQNVSFTDYDWTKWKK